MNFDIEIVACPIIREEDGLAKSSRNTYLNADERKAALCLSQALKLGREMIENGEKNAQTVINAMTELIEKEPLARIDYIEIVDIKTLEKADDASANILTAMAVYIGKTRLIDNFIID